MSPIDPTTGQDLPYPGDPGMGMDPGTGGPPPETLDGPAEPPPPIGVSLNPAQMAAIAMQAVAEIAGIDLQAFQAGQEQALAQMPAAIAAIMQQLQMQAQAPETLDGPVEPMGPATTMPMNPEEQMVA